MNRRKGLVLVGVLVVGSLVVVNAVSGPSTAATDETVPGLVEQLDKQATHVHALGRVSNHPWITRLGVGGFGAAVALAVSSTAVFLYHDRTMR